MTLPSLTDPPTTTDLLAVAQEFALSADDIERFPLLVVRRLWEVHQRHQRSLVEAFEAGRVEGRKEGAT